MANEVENRVVELEFDNKEFEKNASTSLSTLEKLKQSLEFRNSSKGFAEIQNGIKNLDFSPIQNSLTGVEDAFTTLAGSIKRNFFDEIANQALQVGKTLYDNTIGQIKSGGKRRALNIEQAKFKISGLGYDWEDVYGSMDEAVSGTAYGIDQAANAAAQFLASNVNTGEDMTKALRGISGIAAMTSSSYDDIAQVFTAAAGKGRVQAMELNRISLRGVNATAALADELGTTEAAVRDMASKGEIDFQTFANAMDNAFGEHAKKANETFTGSLSNVKAALSRIGEIFYAPYIQGMIPVFNTLRENIDKIKNALKEPIRGKDSVATQISNLASAISGFSVEVLKSIGWNLENLASQFGGLFDKMKKAEKRFKSFTEVFRTYNRIREKAKAEEEAAAGKSPTEKTVDNAVSTAMGPSELQMTGIAMTLGNTMTVLDKDVGITVGSIIDQYKSLYDAQKSVLQSTTNLFSKWSASYKTSFKELNKNLKSNKWGLEKLSQDMATLESKGVSEKFIQNLKNMGTNGAEIVHALATASDKEIKEYMSTWEQTQGLFDTITTDWTAGARNTAEQTLAQVTGIPNASMNETMKAYDAMFNQLGLSSANGYTNGFTQGYEIYENQIADYNASLSDNSEEKKKAEEENEELEDTFEDLEEKIFENSHGLIKLNGIFNDFSNIANILQLVGKKLWKIFEAVGEAFRDVWYTFNFDEFGDGVAGPISILIFYFERLIRNFKIAGERAELIRSTFRGLFSILELGKFILSNILELISPITDAISSGEPTILRITGAIGDFIYQLVQAIVNGEEIPGILGLIINAVSGLTSGFIRLITGQTKLSDFFIEIKDTIVEFLHGMGDQGIFSTILENILSFAGNVIDIIKNVFGSDGETEGFGFLDWIKGIFTPEDSEKEGIFEKIKKWISEIDIDISDVWDKASSFLSKIGEGLSIVWKTIVIQSANINRLFTSIFNFVSKLFESGANHSDKMDEVFTAFADFITVAFITARDIVWAIKDPLKEIAVSVTEVVSGIAHMLSGITNWVGNDPEQAYGAAAFFSLIELFKKIMEYKTTTKKGSFVSMLASITTFFDDMKTAVDSWKKEKTYLIFEVIGNTMLKMAVSMFIIVAAMTGLFSEDKDKQKDSMVSVLVGFAMLSGFIWEIFGLMVAMKKVFNQPLEVGYITAMMWSMAGVMFVLSAGVGIIVAAAGDNIRTLIIAMSGIALMIAAMIAVVERIIKVAYTAPTMDVQRLAMISAMIRALGMAMSSIVNAVAKMMIVMRVMAATNGGNYEEVWISVAEVFALIALMLLAMGGAMAAIMKSTPTNTKAMIGVVILLIALTLCIKSIVNSVIEVAALTAIIPMTDLWQSFAFVAAVAGVITALLVILTYIVGNSNAGTGMLAGMAGIAAILLVVGNTIMQIAMAAALIQAAGVSEENMKSVLIIVGIVAALIAIMTGIMAAVGGTAGAGVVAFAAGLALLAISVYLVAQAIATIVQTIIALIGTFVMLATVWPQIRGIMPVLVEEFDKYFPEFIKTIGKGIIELCKQIIIAAPLIATAIITVLDNVLRVMFSKIPITAKRFLIMIDETLNHVIKGMNTILPKLLYILLVGLAYLDTYAVTLGYKLGSVLIKVIWGALKAVLNFLFETALPEAVKGIVDWFKDFDLDEAMMSSEEAAPENTVTYSHQKVRRFRNEEGELITTGTWYNAKTGKYYDTREEAEDALMYDALAENEAKAHTEKVSTPTMVEFDTSSVVAGTPAEDLKDLKDQYQGELDAAAATEDATFSVKGLVESGKNMFGIDDKEVEKEAEKTGEKVGKTEAKSADNARKEYAKKQLEQGYSLFGKKTMDKVVALSKKSAKKSGLVYGEDFASEAEKYTSGINMDVDTSAYEGNYTKIMDQYGMGDIQSNVGVTPELQFDESGNPVMDGLLNGEGNVDVTGETDLNYVNQNEQKQNEVLEGVKNSTDALIEAVKSAIIVPKDTDVKITSSIDGSKLSQKIYPLLKALGLEESDMANAGIAK